MDAHVHDDARVHCDPCLDADSQSDPGPGAGLKATEDRTRGHVNPGSGFTDPNPDTGSVSTADCTASPYGVPDADGRQSCGRQRHRLGDRRDPSRRRRDRLGRATQARASRGSDPVVTPPLVALAEVDGSILPVVERRRG